MQELEIAEVHYRTGRLDAYQQLHVFRKLSPLLSGLFETIARTSQAIEGAKAANGSVIEAEIDAFSAIGPVARAFAEMPQDDLDFVLKTCLGVCTRRNQQGAWVKVSNEQGQLMFEEIDLNAMLRLANAVVQDNLSNFFRDGLGAVFGLNVKLPLPLNGSA